jgi:hypothetical protein
MRQGKQTTRSTRTSGICCCKRARQVMISFEDASEGLTCCPATRLLWIAMTASTRLCASSKMTTVSFRLIPSDSLVDPGKRQGFLGRLRSETWGLFRVCLFNESSVCYGFRATSLSTWGKGQRVNLSQSFSSNKLPRVWANV